MPRNSLTDKEKDFVRRYRIEGGNWLAETLNVSRAAIYQYAPDNLVLACFRCNYIKSTLCYTCPEFRNKISTSVDK
jgi:hypothetical protein